MTIERDVRSSLGHQFTLFRYDINNTSQCIRKAVCMTSVRNFLQFIHYVNTVVVSRYHHPLQEYYADLPVINREVVSRKLILKLPVSFRITGHEI
jgi:hypothetical protein